MKTWRERVADAKERGRFTDQDVDLAADWNSCAVGEQHALHPFIVKLFPTNMFQEGFDFITAVSDDRIDEADALLDRIEDRVLQLKRDASA